MVRRRSGLAELPWHVMERAVKAFWAKMASANILYQDIPGAGTPLVFIHGLGCASSCDYPRVIADTALAGRRAILVDLLGSGFSERPADFCYSIEGHARSVAGLIGSVCEGPVSLFGHSMGGAVAITLAALLPKVEALVLGEPNLEPGGGFFSKAIADMSEGEFVARGHAATVAAARAVGNTVWAASLAISAPFAVHREAASLIAGCKPTWREMLASLTMRKTLLVGEHSLPAPEFDGLADEGCGVAIVPQAGHSMAWDNPGGLAEAIAKATG